MTLSIFFILVPPLFFLVLTILSIVGKETDKAFINGVIFVFCTICVFLIASSLVKKNLLNNNCGTNFTHAEVLFANSTVKNIYESKGSCYPKYEEEQSTETNPE